MSDTTKVPALPPANKDNLVEVVNAMREQLQVRNGERGNAKDAFVRVRDLANAGVVQLLTDNSIAPPYIPELDLTPPAVIVGFTVEGMIDAIFMDWVLPSDKNFGQVQVWRNTINKLAYDIPVPDKAILLGQTQGSTYTDTTVKNGQTYYYWVRSLNLAGVPGPFNAMDGTPGQTAVDVPFLLDQLTGQITNSQLNTSLTSRINMIDDPLTSPNSVNARVQKARDDAIAAGFGPAGTFTLFKANDFQNLSDKTNQAYAVTSTLVSGTGTTTALVNNLKKVQSLFDANGNLINSATSINDVVSNVDLYQTDANGNFVLDANKNKIRIKASTYISNVQTAINAVTDGKLLKKADASSVTSLQATLGVPQPNSYYWYYPSPYPSNPALAGTYDYTRTAAGVPVTDALSAIKEAKRIGLTATSATSSAVTQLTARMNVVKNADGTNKLSPTGGTMTFEQNAQVTSDSVSGLQGQYTVKLDASNGLVSGFGLSSTSPINGLGTTSFGVRADQFWIGAPGATITQKPALASMPFIVQATPGTTADGDTIPAGVYMNSAYIVNGTITTAKIGHAAITNAKIVSLTADKITTGSLSASTQINVGNTMVIDGVSSNIRVSNGPGGATLVTLGKLATNSYGILIQDTTGATVLNSGGIQKVGYSKVVSDSLTVPAPGATKNVISYQTTAPTSPGAGDMWCNITAMPYVWSIYSGGWKAVANYSTNTNQLTDGAGLGTTATWTGVTGTGKPANNATKNIVSIQTTTPGSPTAGDLWADTSHTPTVWKTYNGTAWVTVANNVTDTAQITDSKGLGNTALWSGVTGATKPADNATKNNFFRQSTPPTTGTFTAGDMWFNTNSSQVYVANIGANGWTLVGDVTSSNIAAGILGQGALAKVSQINTGNVSTYIGAGCIGNAYIGNFISSNNFDGVVDSNGNISNQGTVGWCIGKAGNFVTHGSVSVSQSIKGGSFTGYAWPPYGQSGYYIGPEGVLFGNYNNGPFFQMSTGLAGAPGVWTNCNLMGSTGTFSGNLSAASGTFSGTLTAANVVTTGNLANNSVTNSSSHLSGYSGSNITRGDNGGWVYLTAGATAIIVAEYWSNGIGNGNMDLYANRQSDGYSWTLRSTYEAVGFGMNHINWTVPTTGWYIFTALTNHGMNTIYVSILEVMK